MYMRLTVCSITLNALVLWTTSSGFTGSDCNNAPVSSGTLWIDTCSNGTMSVTWDLRTYSNRRIAPLEIGYTCVNISQVNETVASSEFNVGNIKYSSTAIIDASYGLVCSISLCHQFGNQFTQYTLGPTACSLGESTSASTYASGTVLSSADTTMTMLDVSNANINGCVTLQASMVVPRPTGTYSPMDKVFSSNSELQQLQMPVSSLQITDNYLAATLSSLPDVYETHVMSTAGSYSTAKPKNDPLLIGVGVAVSLVMTLMVLLAVFVFKVSQRTGTRLNEIRIEKELQKAITSPCKVDLYLKQNQSVDSVSTELDNLELSDDASQSQDQNAEEADCSHQRKFEANLRSEPIIIEDSAQSLNVMTTGSLVQSEDGTMHSSASGSSGLPDYQDNYD